MGAGVGGLSGSGLEALDQGFCGLRGASGSMKLFSSVSSRGGLELSSLSEIRKKNAYSKQNVPHVVSTLAFSLVQQCTFVAEVVLAASSVAGGTGGARGAMFVR